MNDLKTAIERGTKAWADVPSDWVDKLRGNDTPEVTPDVDNAYTKFDTSDRVLHKEWVGLTVDEIDKFMPYCNSDQDLSEFRTFAFEIEAKLKEKNVPQP